VGPRRSLSGRGVSVRRAPSRRRPSRLRERDAAQLDLRQPASHRRFDLRETPASQALRDLGGEFTWVGIGHPTVSATLIQSGVEASDGTRGTPSLEMWRNIDPDGEFEARWNRDGTVFWNSSKGKPVVTNPATDTIWVSLDAFSNSAKQDVDFVSTNRVADQTCLEEVSRFPSQGDPHVL